MSPAASKSSERVEFAKFRVPVAPMVEAPRASWPPSSSWATHRGKKPPPLTASLSLFNIPVISASRYATRECCLCTDPGFQATPRGSLPGGFCARVQGLQRALKSLFQPIVEADTRELLYPLNIRGNDTRRGRWFNYHRAELPAEGRREGGMVPREAAVIYLLPVCWLGIVSSGRSDRIQHEETVAGG